MYHPTHSGLVLREYLENISVTEAAQRLGVTPPPYRAFSTAKRPSVQKWQFACQFCSIPASQMWLSMQAAYDL
ncbi:Plasmid maintenance system antidote protein, XRE family [Neisseria zoodegmatis]|uniref:Plasmid maintenance system antidote protein, XRE family n=1 Tax=Neisseria zoodegmatis TaxID=326523 RepID=A0A378WTB2_9NEIS|nr:addiction module antidote protein, HigA family [Neisseria zoodegmatis]SUA43855.1 Plasmid maintenance system antidote protein, XRE family [Neisseria zoodegmatis]